MCILMQKAQCLEKLMRHTHGKLCRERTRERGRCQRAKISPVQENRKLPHASIAISVAVKRHSFTAYVIKRNNVGVLQEETQMISSGEFMRSPFRSQGESYTPGLDRSWQGKCGDLVPGAHRPSAHALQSFRVRRPRSNLQKHQ